MKLLILLIFPLSLFSQQFYSHSAKEIFFEEYYYLSKEIDLRNTVFKGTNSTSGYNGALKLGYKNNWYNLEVFYETYPNIKYESFGVNINGFINNTRAFRQGLGVQVSTIHRPTKLVQSYGLNGILEYHLNSLVFVSIRAEGKLRTDWKPSFIRISVLTGIGIKLGRH